MLVWGALGFCVAYIPSSRKKIIAPKPRTAGVPKEEVRC